MAELDSEVFKLRALAEAKPEEILEVKAEKSVVYAETPPLNTTPNNSMTEYMVAAEEGEEGPVATHSSPPLSLLFLFLLILLLLLQHVHHDN